MIIHDYDTETAPVVDLEVFYGKPKHIVEKCIILYSKDIYEHLLETYSCEVIGRIGACNGGRDICCFQADGETMAFYLSPLGSAMASGTCYEVNWLTGASQFVMFGSCGSLDEEKTRGRYIIPTESYRGEGCSYYYAPPSDYIMIRNADRISAMFDEIGAPYIKGRVWSTDSMIRETAGLVHRRKGEGCLAVEMELAGVQAVCDYYGFELFNFLEAGDVLKESGTYDAAGLNSANHDLGKLNIALEIMKRI